MLANKTERLFLLFSRSAVVGCIIALAALSWLPADELARTDLGGHAEHVIAYMGTAIVLGLAFRLRLDLQCLLLATFAAILETGQLFAPGRHASVDDFAFSTSGVLLGGLLQWLARSWIKIHRERGNTPQSS